jgi:DNA-binding beta-propeller fold protein YncE
VIRAGVAALVVAALATGAAEAPVPLAQLPGTAGCIGPRLPGCTVGGIGTAATAAVAPSGRNVYAAGGVGGARIFRGTLALSPDGASLYAATGGSLYVFSRDPDTGELDDAVCYDAAGAAGCTRVEGLGRPSAVAVSSDGGRVYTAAGGRAVRAFTRPDSTSLTPLASVAVPFRALTLASAGRFVAVGGDRGVALVGASGLRGTVTRIRGPRGPYAVAASPDGRSVYAAGAGGLAVLVAR